MNWFEIKSDSHFGLNILPGLLDEFLVELLVTVIAKDRKITSNLHRFSIADLFKLTGGHLSW